MLGPGLLWSKSQSKLEKAIEIAESNGDSVSAGHLRIILERNRKVAFVTEEDYNNWVSSFHTSGE